VTSHPMVELYDIMATFLELAGTQARHTHFARSLLPQIHGGPGDPLRASFSEGGSNVYDAEKLRLGGLYGPKSALLNDRPETASRCASIKTGRYTYIARPGGQNELYDRSTDPWEEHNLIDDRSIAATRAELQQRLINWYINTSGVPEHDGDPRDLPQFNPPSNLQIPPEVRTRILDL